MQHEITRPIPLLDAQGNLTEPGWARRLLPAYDRSAVRGGRTRRKEWDYYLVMGEGFALALTIADNSYMGLDSISLLDFREGWQVTKSPMRALPMGRTGLPETSERGNTVSVGRGYGLLFQNDGETRTLTAHMDAFRAGAALDARVALTQAPEESIVICTPFAKPGHFYYNQKINCMRASGTVALGKRVYRFDPSNSFGTLDWGRGVWTYHNTWYWGSASGLAGGVPFGFNIGYGFGDTSAASENALFYNGRLPQARPGGLPHPGPGRKAGLSGALERYQRRRALCDGLSPRAGPRGPHRRPGDPIRPASGLRGIHRAGGAGRRHGAGGAGSDGICRAGGKSLVKGRAPRANRPGGVRHT